MILPNKASAWGGYVDHTCHKYGLLWGNDKQEIEPFWVKNKVQCTKGHDVIKLIV